MDSSMVLTGVIGLLAGAVFGVLGLYIYRQMLDEKVRDFAKVEADRIMSKAKSNANRLERDAQKKAKDFEVRARRNAENDIRKEKQKIQQVEGQSPG